MGGTLDTDAGKTQFRAFVLVGGGGGGGRWAQPSLRPFHQTQRPPLFLCFPGDEDVLINQRMSLKSAARAQ